MYSWLASLAYWGTERTDDAKNAGYVELPESCPVLPPDLSAYTCKSCKDAQPVVDVAIKSPKGVMVARQPIAVCAKEHFHDCSSVIIFQDNMQILYSTSQASQAELKALTQVFADRDIAIRKGLIFEGKRFEVHRHHPPLVYGRSLIGEPEQSEGAAICKVERGPGGTPAYAAITYPMPHVSARMVELLREFCERELAQRL